MTDECETKVDEMFMKVFSRCDTLHDFVYDSRGDKKLFAQVAAQVRHALDKTELSSTYLKKCFPGKINDDVIYANKNARFVGGEINQIPSLVDPNVEQKITSDDSAKRQSPRSIVVSKKRNQEELNTKATQRHAQQQQIVAPFEIFPSESKIYVLYEVSGEQWIKYKTENQIEEKLQSTLFNNKDKEYRIHYNKFGFVWFEGTINFVNGPYIDETDFYRFYNSKVTFKDDLTKPKAQPYLIEEDKQYKIENFQNSDYVEMWWSKEIKEGIFVPDSKMANVSKFFHIEGSTDNSLVFFKILIRWESENKVQHYSFSYLCKGDIEYDDNKRYAKTEFLYEVVDVEDDEDEDEDDDEEEGEDDDGGAQSSDTTAAVEKVKLKKLPKIFIVKQKQKQNHLTSENGVNILTIKGVQFKKIDYSPSPIFLDALNYKRSNVGGWVLGNDKFRFESDMKKVNENYDRAAIKMLTSLRPDIIPDFVRMDNKYLFAYNPDPNSFWKQFIPLTRISKYPFNSNIKCPFTCNVKPKNLKRFANEVITKYFYGFFLCIDMPLSQISNEFPIILTTSCLWDSSTASDHIIRSIRDKKRELRTPWDDEVRITPPYKYQPVYLYGKVITSEDMENIFFLEGTAKPTRSIKMLKTETETELELELKDNFIYENNNITESVKNIRHLTKINNEEGETYKKKKLILKTVGLLKQFIAKKTNLLDQYNNVDIFPQEENNVNHVNECINIKRSGDALQVKQVKDLNQIGKKVALLTGDQLCFFQCVAQKVPAISFWFSEGIYHITLFNPSYINLNARKTHVKRGRKDDKVDLAMAAEDVIDKEVDSAMAEEVDKEVDKEVDYAMAEEDDKEDDVASKKPRLNPVPKPLDALLEQLLSLYTIHGIEDTIRNQKYNLDLARNLLSLEKARDNENLASLYSEKTLIDTINAHDNMIKKFTSLLKYARARPVSGGADSSREVAETVVGYFTKLSDVFLQADQDILSEKMVNRNLVNISCSEFIDLIETNMYTDKIKVIYDQFSYLNKIIVSLKLYEAECQYIHSLEKVDLNIIIDSDLQSNYDKLLEYFIQNYLPKISSLSHLSELTEMMDDFMDITGPETSTDPQENACLQLQYALDRISLWGFDFSIIQALLPIKFDKDKEPSCSLYDQFVVQLTYNFFEVTDVVSVSKPYVKPKDDIDFVIKYFENPISRSLYDYATANFFTQTQTPAPAEALAARLLPPPSKRPQTARPPTSSSPRRQPRSPPRPLGASPTGPGASPTAGGGSMIFKASTRAMLFVKNLFTMRHRKNKS